MSHKFTKEMRKFIYLMYFAKDEDILLEINTNSVLSDITGRDFLLYYAVFARRSKVVKELLDTICRADAYSNDDYSYAIHNITKKQSMFLLLSQIEFNNENIKELIEMYGYVAKKMKLSNSVNTSIIKEVLKGNKPSREDLKLLDYRAHKEELYIVKMLLDYGADINIKDGWGNCTALHYAAYHGNIDMVNLLLSYKADTSAKSYEGYCVFYYSVWSENIYLIKEMLKYYDYTKDCECLEVAMYCNNIQVLLCLLEMGLNVNSLGFNNNTPLHKAGDSCNPEIVKILLSHGANINSRCKYLITPLHAFAAVSDYNNVKLLLDKGSDIHAKDYKGKTPLHNAVINYRKSSLEIVKTLLDLGADVNARDNEGNTPLHEICYYSRSSNCDIIVNMLIEYGADPNAENINRSIPLHNVSKSINLIKILMEAGSNPNIVNNFCKTPLESIIYNNELSAIYIIPYIISRYSKYEPCADQGIFNNLQIIEKYNFMTQLKLYCEKELQSIRAIRITNDYSLDIFINSYKDYETILLCNNPNVNIDVSAFPMYGKIIKSNIDKARNRIRLLQNAFSVIESSFNNEVLTSIPAETKYYILSSFSDKELELYASNNNWMLKLFNWIVRFFTRQ
ncbi:SWPV1-265 [Shearwaterpox virus]|uniref:SWPV1-265 n=1 Tax=Shearwaterpox virus TaxID=1974596 RepID=A0A1V0S872_CNPV|nr:SWPV1-265 [Shearwaterpox virus]